MMNDIIRCSIDAKAALGEATLWDSVTQSLWWLDIFSKKIHQYYPDTDDTHSFSTPFEPGSLAIRKSGGLMIAMADGFYFFDPSDGQFEHIIDAESEIAETRMNDGKTDRHGRFWSGTVFNVPEKPFEAIGGLYRLDIDLSCKKMVADIGCSNGMAWSPGGEMIYFSDSCTPYVWAWDVDVETGDMDNRRIFIDLSDDEGRCDGATVDAEGCYWLTLPKTGRIQRYDPMGRLMRTIKLPTDAPTCCEFGGRDLDILFVTTATLRRSAAELRDQPLAGGLFAIDAGVKGLPAAPFAG